jgi:hypothetical protein
VRECRQEENEPLLKKFVYKKSPDERHKNTSIQVLNSVDTTGFFAVESVLFLATLK